ncbi:hypothetical protein ECDEC4C_1126 [Escherichia coli DEC4C]|nr:hypothetical protein ECDEC4C_1126 [Escherichia coli DEC4C]EHV16923.1 hypothetical protein ECDEC4E_1262 [Escherichia coli DEC4E]
MDINDIGLIAGISQLDGFSFASPGKIIRVPVITTLANALLLMLMENTSTSKYAKMFILIFSMSMKNHY